MKDAESLIKRMRAWFPMASTTMNMTPVTGPCIRTLLWPDSTDFQRKSAITHNPTEQNA
jgi:hypothetical protein